MSMSFLKALQLNARRFPRKQAIVFEESEITYREMYHLTLAFMQQLKELGIGPDDKVAILSENHPNFLVATFAITGLGAIPSLINYRLEASDVKAVIKNADCCAVVLGPGWESLSETGIEGISHYFCIEESDQARTCPVIPMRKELVQGEWVPDLSRAGTMIMYHTSGTTGLPKGVMRSKMGFEQRCAEYGANAEDAMLCVLPCCLSAGVTFANWALYIGSTLYLHRKVDYRLITGDIERYQPAITFLLPNMLNQLIEEGSFATADLSSIRCIITGGGYINDHLRQVLRQKLGDVLTIFYGSSEIGPTTSMSAKEVPLAYRDNCIGRPFFGADVVLLDENLKEVPVGEVGRISVRSECQLQTYYKNDALMAEITLGDYLSVGDMGRVDENGYIYFVGRQRDFIRTGGINVAAGDIESVVVNHPDVSEAYCVGVPDPKWGEAICVVVVKKSAELDEKTVMDYAAGELPGFKRPRYVVFMDSVPMNLSGRVLKHELQEIVKERLTGSK